MSLTPRHHWVISKIVAAFEPDLESMKVQQFCRQSSNAAKLLSFFEGKSADNKLFVFYQSPTLDQSELVRANDAREIERER